MNKKSIKEIISDVNKDFIYSKDLESNKITRIYKLEKSITTQLKSMRSIYFDKYWAEYTFNELDYIKTKFRIILKDVDELVKLKKEMNK